MAGISFDLTVFQYTAMVSTKHIDFSWFNDPQNTFAINCCMRYWNNVMVARPSTRNCNEMYQPVEILQNSETEILLVR